MPRLNDEPVFNLINVKELHPTFGAEINGVDFSKPVEDDVFQEILAAITKYGVCVFRDTQLDDSRHVQFGAKFGELDDVTPYLAGGRAHRLPSVQLFDVGNIDLDGSVFALDHVRWELNKPLPCRLQLQPSSSRVLPPPGPGAPTERHGGNTDFADTRTAFDELDEDLKRELLEEDYIAAHSLWNSRKVAAPETFKDVDPSDYPFGRHKLVQMHEPSSRMNLYIAAHVHHIDGLEEEKSKELFDKLYKHAQQPKYILSVEWEHDGDLILWDNTAVMHRATGGSFEGKYKRDMRRVTVHDGSSFAWGLNEKGNVRQGFP
ncbi:hypothetical protein V1517DRAFT_340138 [Lipomyces orientalis]|uniref:Uncharacterized protein n=1 Tax=Lipomyces orientalis TaxID=1233043 RepID=A0ACC3TLU3_9ASCO